MHLLSPFYQSININQTIAANRSKQVVSTDKAKTKSSFKTFEFARKNKFAILAVTFLFSNLILSFKPEHIKRPEVLARNRLSKNE